MIPGRSIPIFWPAPADRRLGRWARLRRQWRELVLISPLLRNVIGLGLLARSLGLQRSRDARLTDLVTATRFLSNRALRVLLGRLLRPWQQGEAAHIWHRRRIEWDKYATELKTPQLTTSLVLKAPGPGGEKGVLYCSFEYNWLRLTAHPSAERLLSEYLLVGATSWSPSHYGAMLSLAAISSNPVFVGISNPADTQMYKLLAPRVRTLPIMASDWTNPSFYSPRPFAERDIDLLMVANFTDFKRHWLLFEALKRMRRDLRVTLIGIPGPGRGVRELRAEAAAIGVRQDLEILPNVPIETVTSYQCRAKTSVILSLREGSCVAVAESLFAGTPVAMLRHAHVGSKTYINPETGVLVSEAGLDRQLSAFLEAGPTFHPREWAEAHISCHHASRRLNDILRGYARESGSPWTNNITPMCWRYVPSYVDSLDEGRLAPEVARIRDEYGIELEKFQYRAH